MRVNELRAQVQAQRYRVDPRLVAEALIQRSGATDRTLSHRAGAQSPATAPPRHGAR
jgi:hypothetical protein